MARPLRLLVADGHYHVTARSWDRSPLYRGDADRLQFLGQLKHAVGRFDWRCLAYCLMDNHFHLVLRTPLANLPRGMQRLNSGYAQWFNRQRERKGPVFEDRYHAELIQRDAHLLEVYRYVALNPVRAGVCRDPCEYRWSSHRAIAGHAEAPGHLSVSEAHAVFAAATGMDGVQAYREFVAAFSDAAPRGGPVFGDERFVRDALRDVSRHPEVPRRDWGAGRPPLSELLGASGAGADLSKAYRTHGYTMTSLAQHLGRHVSTVSRRIAAHERDMLDCKI